MSLGTLRVLLGLDAAEFTNGLTKAEQALKKTEQRAQSFSRTLSNSVAVGVAKAAVALAVLDRAGGFLIRMGFDAINTAASFQDMSEKTGASAEALASFQTAASVTNTSMETLANLSVKLTKGLAGTDEETKQAANAIKQLGFNVDEFKKLDPAAQFEAIGKRLNEFGDGAGKTAFAVAAMGRSGADALPFLKELGEQGKRNVILTAAQIKAADDFVDAQARATSQLKQYLQIASVQALEALTPLVKVFGELAKQILGVDSATNTLKNNNGIQEWATSIVDKIAFVADAIGGLNRLFKIAGERIDATLAQIKLASQGDFKGVNRVGEDFANRANDILMEKTFRQELAEQRAKQVSAANAFEANFPERDKKKLRVPDFGGGGGASAAASKAAQEAKKLLDKQLSDLDNFIKAEKRIFETRESDLARLYQNDQISIAAYFDERLAALDRNTTATIEIYNKQIKAQEAFAAAAKRRKDEPAVIDAQTKIGDIQSRIEDVLHEKQQRKLKIQDDITQAAGDYADQVSEVRARVLELLGTEEAALEAARLRFDIQNRSVIKGAKREKDSALEADIAALRKQGDAQTQINGLLKDAGVIEQNLATAQAKLHLERDLGMRDEITTLDLVGKASGEAAAKLKIIADQYLAIALASGKPEIIANALALKQRVDELAAATDILAAKIRQTFVDTGASAIETFLNSIADGKNVLDSFKAAFTQFANDIIRQINRIAAQKIADSLFKSGSGGGDGGIFSDIADAFVKYIGGLGGAEKGGPVSSRTPYIVGERGPEIFVPQTVAAAATKQIDSLIAQRGKPAQYTDRVKAATVATNLPHLIGTKGPEIFVPKVDGIVIPNDKVNKLSNVLQGRAKRVSATPRIADERGSEVFTPRNAATLGPHEKVVTRLVSSLQPTKASTSHVASNMPRVVGARGPELFVPKAAGIIIPNDKVAKLASALERKAAPAAAMARRREISAPLVTSRTIMRDEKIITRYANAPYSRRAGGGPVAAHVPYIVGERGREIFIPKSANAAVQREEAISKLSTAFQKQGHSVSAATAQATRIISERQIYIKQSASAIQQNRRVVAELVANAPRQRRAGGGPVAARTPYVVGELGPELFMPKSAGRIIKNEKAIDDLVSNKIQHRAISGPNIKYVLGGHEIFISKQFASTKTKNDLVSNTAQYRASVKNEMVHNDLVSNTRNEKTINQLVSHIQRGPFAAHQTYLIDEREIPKSARKVIKNKKLVDDIVSSVQRRAIGGPVAAHQTYLVGELGPELFMPKFASKIIKNEKVIYDLVTNTIQHKAQGGPIEARQTYIVGERGPELFVTRSAEKIIKNESRVSELVTNNAKRNEKVINDLVSKTVHHKQSAGSVAAPNVAAEIIKNESRISELVSNDVQRNEEIINRLITTTRRESGRSNELLIVGAHGPELFIPKAAGRIIKNERRINELVSNIEHRNIDRHSEKTIDEIIASTVQHRAQRGPVGTYQKYRERVAEVPKRIIKSEALLDKAVKRKERVIADIGPNIQRRAGGGPVSAYQKYLVGERGPEIYMPRDKDKVGGIKVPADFFTNKQHHRAHGGAVAANQPYLVGERGPEAFIPKAAGRIVRNDDIGRQGGSTVEQTINFILPNQITAQTQNQIASRTLFAARRAVARGVA